jgi:hypothetical protein
MKTIYLKQLKSKNYHIGNKENFTIKFSTKKAFIEWYQKNITGYTSHLHSYGSRIIKATYSQSQTYYSSAREFLTKNN